jgi:hypothetical protein
MDTTFDELIDIAQKRLNALRGAEEHNSWIIENAIKLGLVFQVLTEIESRLMPKEKDKIKEFKQKVNEVSI